MSLQPENTDNLKVHILLIHQAFAALDEPGGTRHIEMARAFAKQGHRVTIITSPVNYLTGRSSQAKAQWPWWPRHPFNTAPSPPLANNNTGATRPPPVLEVTCTAAVCQEASPWSVGVTGRTIRR